MSGVPLAYRTLLRGHHRQRVSIKTQRPWGREHKDHRTSVHIPTVSHAEQHYPEEDFINSQTSVQELSTREATITFHVTENTTQREKRKLVSSDGYTYVDKKENKSGSIVLRCSVRNSKTTCPATVLQHGDTFTTNSKEHTYASKPGNLLRWGKGARSAAWNTDSRLCLPLGAGSVAPCPGSWGYRY